MGIKCCIICQQPFEVWQIIKFFAQSPTELVLFYQVVKMFAISVEETSRSSQIKGH